jgi:hypothetical protein
VSDSNRKTLKDLGAWKHGEDVSVKSDSLNLAFEFADRVRSASCQITLTIVVIDRLKLTLAYKSRYQVEVVTEVLQRD